MIHNCDLCNSSERTEIEPGICVCMKCGFCYVPERRTAKEIALAWSEVYSSGAYSSAWPGVRARLFYCAEWIDQNIGLAGKSVLDIGAGQGFFLEQAKARGAHPVGLEPDSDNCRLIRSKGITCFLGAVEDHPDFGKHDLVTILWTLENCGDCLAMLRWARNHLAPGGRVVVATGSRILVPFKKPYSSYFGKLAADLHAFRWSVNSLYCALARVGFTQFETNDFNERDEMIVVAGSPRDAYSGKSTVDDPQAVIDFFRQWKSQWP